PLAPFVEPHPRRDREDPGRDPEALLVLLTRPVHLHEGHLQQIVRHLLTEGAPKESVQPRRQPREQLLEGAGIARDVSSHQLLFRSYARQRAQVTPLWCSRSARRARPLLRRRARAGWDGAEALPIAAPA